VHLVRESWRKLLPEKWRAITEEFAKFGTIGVINLFVNLGVANLLWLTVLSNGEVKAKAIATIVATTCAYFMNRHWTYRDRPKSTLRREYSLFFLFNLVGFIIEVAVVYIAKYGFEQTHIVVLNLVTGVGIVLGTIFRFWAYRTHVFRRELPTTVAIEAAVAGPAALTATHFVDDGDLDDDLIDADLAGSEFAGSELAGSELAGSAEREFAVDAEFVEVSVDDGPEVDDVEIELDGIVALAEEPAKPRS
jgi:putative flippase GtrA